MQKIIRAPHRKSVAIKLMYELLHAHTHAHVPILTVSGFMRANASGTTRRMSCLRPLLLEMSSISLKTSIKRNLPGFSTVRDTVHSPLSKNSLGVSNSSCWWSKSIRGW